MPAANDKVEFIAEKIVAIGDREMKGRDHGRQDEGNSIFHPLV
jgi:hypothetical protein